MSTISSVSTPFLSPSTINRAKRSPHETPTQRTDGSRPLVAASKAVTAKKVPGSPSQEQQAVIVDLRQRDAEVRRHEAAHASAGGQFAGAPSFQFTKGPDGRSYAVSGEVPIDLSPVPDDPQATIQKMRQVKRAALAPANPSAADRGVAASADQQALAAQLELNKQRAEETRNQLDTAQEASTTPRERSRIAGFNSVLQPNVSALISVRA